MAKKHVHQFVHSYVDYDATSTHARHLQALLREMGYVSEVYAGEWRGQLSKAVSFREYQPTSDAFLLYQLATASPICEFLLQQPSRFAVNYHNVTPYELIAPWEPSIAPELEIARGQMRQLAAKATCGIGVSQYNTNELIAAGYRKTSVTPLLFDPDDFSNELDERVDKSLKQKKHEGGIDILYVGRIAPHKCQHQLIAALAMYRRVFDAHARLHLIGGISSHHYWTVLQRYIAELDLNDAVFMPKGVTAGALGAYYANADVFTCLSEHEGFGVPLIEAMHNNIPVIAYDAAAIGETLGTGGILLDDKSPSTIASVWNRIATDSVLRDALLEAGSARLKHFAIAHTRQVWREVITSLAEA